MNVLIIEDEPLAADRLMKLLHEYDSSIHIMTKIDTVKNAIEWFESNKKPDLAFMDIQLADGLSFNIFDKIDISLPVIFTTAHNEYAIRAFKVNSIDYLLKPIGIKELKTAVDKFKSLNQNYTSVNKESLRVAHEMIDNQFKNRFIVKTGDHIQSIATEKIHCFFSQEKAIFMVTEDQKKYLVDYTLEEIEKMISPKDFYRVNRQHILSINSIKDIINYSNSRLKVILKNMCSEEIIVSREKVADFKAWLDM